jgi:hypothetical protein
MLAVARHWPGYVRGAARLLPVALLCALSACGGGPRLVSGGGGARTDYAAPGPADDPWGPYIREAAQRFSVPERWIRAVMRQESGGRQFLHGQPITSDAGAAGLMQLMPATYAELRLRYTLGADPYDPHDNILAGAAYIGELYALYGSPAFLAAYDAGPHRVDDYMAGRGTLPNETVNYLASVAPGLGNERPMSGPLAAYADNGGAPLTPDPVPRAYAPPGVAACWRDPDAAYDPDAPCRPVPVVGAPSPPPAQVASAARPGAVLWGQGTPASPAPSAGCSRDPDAAYDPAAPCRPQSKAQLAEQVPPAAPAALQRPSAAQPQPVLPRRYASNFLIPSASAATARPAMSAGVWAIQVGAFGSRDQARRVAETARRLAPHELGGAATVLGATAPFAGQVLYRARLLGLSEQEAASACGALYARRQACVLVPPGS